MTLTEDDMTEIGALLAAAGAENDAVAELRRRFPSLTVTRCDASDVTEAPYAVFDRIDLHLLDASDHCATLTADLSRATGLVLAKKETGS